MRTHSIVKPWPASHLEVDFASDHRQGADNFIRLLPVCPNGHVVSELGHTLLRKKSGEKNVRVWQIHLSYASLFELRLNLKTASSLIIEQGCKHGRRIEIWVAEKVDGTVYAHEGNRSHIANDAVVLNRFEAHGCGLFGT